MARFCGSCGTEVDETAVFCPTCGQPIDESVEAEMPAAPAWPDPAATDLDAQEARDHADASRPGAAPWEETPAPASWDGPPLEVDREEAPVAQAPDAPTRAERPVPPTQPAERAVEPPEGQRERRSRQLDLPITMPVTLSSWLIGVGALLAVLGLLIVLVGGILSVIDMLLLLALLGVAVTVFFSANLPGIPHLRLASLVIALIAFGVALDRVGFRGGGAGELLLFLGSAAAAIGALILELGHDQPLGRPQS